MSNKPEDQAREEIDKMLENFGFVYIKVIVCCFYEFFAMIVLHALLFNVILNIDYSV